MTRSERTKSPQGPPLRGGKDQAGIVMAGAFRSTLTPVVTVVEPSVRSPPPPVAVTVPSRTAVPPDCFNRKWPAVPDAAGATAPGSAAVSTPSVEVHAPAMVMDARSVPDAAVSGVAGLAPERISMIEPVPMDVARAAPMGWVPVATAMLSAMTDSYWVRNTRDPGGSPAGTGSDGARMTPRSMYWTEAHHAASGSICGDKVPGSTSTRSVKSTTVAEFGTTR